MIIAVFLISRREMFKKFNQWHKLGTSKKYFYFYFSKFNNINILTNICVMTSSASEVDDLLTEKFPPVPSRPSAAADLPPGVDEPSPAVGGSGLRSLLGRAAGGRDGVQHLRVGGGGGHHRLFRGEHFRGHKVCGCCGEARSGWCCCCCCC